MKRDDILKMEPGRELDELIMTHIFKAKKIPEGNRETWVRYGGDGIEEDWWPVYYSPSMQIGDAWVILEKLRRPFSTRMRFSKEMQNLMNKGLIESEADIRIAEHEIIWHMTPENICKAALLTTIDE